MSHATVCRPHIVMSQEIRADRTYWPWLETTRHPCIWLYGMKIFQSLDLKRSVRYSRSPLPQISSTHRVKFDLHIVIQHHLLGRWHFHHVFLLGELHLQKSIKSNFIPPCNLLLIIRHVNKRFLIKEMCELHLQKSIYSYFISRCNY